MLDKHPRYHVITHPLSRSYLQAEKKTVRRKVMPTVLFRAMVGEAPINSQGTQYPMTPSTEATVTPVTLTPMSSEIDTVVTNPLGQENTEDRLEPNQPEILATTTDPSENENGKKLAAAEANEAEVSMVANDQRITEGEIEDEMAIEMNEREIETTFTMDTSDLRPILELLTVVRERFRTKAISTSAVADRPTTRCDGKHRAKCLRSTARRFRDETPRGQCK